MPTTIYPVIPVIDLETKQRTGWLCRSGRHEWPEREDARKCCNPFWKRARRIIKSTTGFGVMYLDYAWIEVPASEARAMGKPR